MEHNLNILNKFKLTAAQKQVATLMMSGHSNATIAKLLFKSEKSVKALATFVYRAIKLESRAQFIVTMAKLGWAFEGMEKISTFEQRIDGPVLPRGQ